MIYLQQIYLFDKSTKLKPLNSKSFFLRFSQVSRTKSLQLKAYSLNKNISFVDQIKNYFIDLVVTETNKSISKEIYQEITLGPDQNINLWIVEYLLL